MLELITLATIKKIFDNAHCEVSSLSKMLYINCIMHHFGDLSPIEENSVGFELLDSDVNFDKFKKNFQELKKANIVNINFDGSIIFFPLWNRYIDKTKIEKKVVVIDENKIESTLSESTMFIELVCMKNKITDVEAKSLIKKFAKEQKVLDKKHFNDGDCKKHFLNWVKFNLNTQPKSVVKSNSKILGR